MHDDHDPETDKSDEEQAARIAEEEGENFYWVLHERFGRSREQIKNQFLDPHDPEPDPDLIEFLDDDVGCTNEELGLADDGEPENA